MGRDLLSLSEASARLRPLGRRYVGIRPVELSRIVGSDGRGGDFDRLFSEHRRDVRERVRRVGRAFPAGDFPPIVVEKLGDAYFVVDGHHRVAAARRLGMETLDAEVTELAARWHLSADAGPQELVHAEQERLFMAESGLGDFCRDASCIRFSRPGGYGRLLEAIRAHGYRLLLEGRLPDDRREVALDWYRRVYLPTVAVIREERPERPGATTTDSDWFLWVSDRRSELAAEHGHEELPVAARRALRGLPRRHRRLARLRRG